MTPKAYFLHEYPPQNGTIYAEILCFIGTITVLHTRPRKDLVQCALRTHFKNLMCKNNYINLILIMFGVKLPSLACIESIVFKIQQFQAPSPLPKSVHFPDFSMSMSRGYRLQHHIEKGFSRARVRVQTRVSGSNQGQ